MSDINGKDNLFLAALEKGVLAILRDKKATQADKLSAIDKGVKLAAIKHKVNDDGEEKGFFNK